MIGNINGAAGARRRVSDDADHSQHNTVYKQAQITAGTGAAAGRGPSHSDAPYLSWSVIIVILIWKTGDEIWSKSEGPGMWNYVEIKMYVTRRIFYRRSIKLIDSRLQPPARSMHGTIDYLSLCNKTSGFIHGVCFMLSIWMCKKIHKNKCVWQRVCVCVAVMRCAWDAQKACVMCIRESC